MPAIYEKYSLTINDSALPITSVEFYIKPQESRLSVSQYQVAYFVRTFKALIKKTICNVLFNDVNFHITFLSAHSSCLMLSTNLHFSPIM